MLRVFILLALLTVSCGGEEKKKREKLDVPTAVLATQSDSLSYAVGVSLAQNLELMDSLLDLRVVAAAVAQYGSGNPLFNIEDARSTYLKYLLYVEPERRRSFEEQWLREKMENDRTYTRSRTGILYNITRIGDEKQTPRNNNDWVEVDYIIYRVDGSEEIYSTYKEQKPLSGGLSILPQGIQECVKFLGKGGELTALIPSRLAYGQKGNEELGIAPYETLRYDIELSDTERGAASRRMEMRDPHTF